MKELVEKIGGIIAMRDEYAKIIELEYAGEVEAIIGTASKDQRIERTLDILLDFSFNANVFEIFRKLCKYYYNIDPDSTYSYIQGYREMWDNEEASGAI